MYEVYDAKTGELVRVDLYQLEQGLENGSLISEPKPKRAQKKASDDENQG